MRQVVHRAEDRGSAEHGWLHTRFSFSFADWYDPERMGFGVLRVLNDDIIEPRTGFGMHPHANMEIITLVTEGVVSHEDSMGNRYEIPAGNIQVMSAGSGVVHAEYNKQENGRLALFQIWITPQVKGLPPRYAERSLGIALKNQLELLVSGDLDSSALYINQDASLYRLVCDAGRTIPYAFKKEGHGVYIFVISGTVRVGEVDLGPRDAMGIWETGAIDLLAQSPAELLLFDVPME